MGIKIKGLEHISWAAPTPDQLAKTLAVFGFDPTLTEEIHSQQVLTTYYHHPNGLRFEIIRPLTKSSQLTRVLEKRGPGLHHIWIRPEGMSFSAAAAK